MRKNEGKMAVPESPNIHYCRCGHSQGCAGAAHGLDLCNKQPSQCFASASNSAPIPGHHTKLLLSAFILIIPMWPS